MSERFTPLSTRIEGLTLLERKVVADQRGSFHRLFCADELRSVGWISPIAQINFSQTALRGTIRGMHFQKPPYAEMKLVTCLRGSILDVAVDLRFGSKTLLKWFATELSAENCRSILVPEGFAHGFQALTDDVQLLYAVSSPYTAHAEDGLNPLDETIGIEWPLAVSSISTRDAAQPQVAASFEGLRNNGDKAS